MYQVWLWIRSAFFLLAFYMTSAVILVILSPTLVSRRATYWAAQVWTRTARWLVRYAAGIKIEYRGMENLPKKGGFIIASKHQSALETLMFHPVLKNLFFVFKKELLWVPIAGLYAVRTDCVPIDRGGGASTMRKMLDHVQGNLKDGLNLVIFPEGTRVKPGAKHPYGPGIAFLYDQCHVPVVPVALNTGYFWPKNSVLKYPGTAVIEFLKPIEPGLHKRAFLNELEDRIEERQSKFEDPKNGSTDA